MIKYSEVITKRARLKDVIPLRTPFTLHIDPTNVCNFKCRFCPRNQPDFADYAGKYQHMTYGLFEKILADGGGGGFLTRLKSFDFSTWVSRCFVPIF